MSTTYLDFRVIGYNGVESLSTYSLSSTPLTFVPEFTPTVEDTHRVMWEFGDGTSSRSFSAKKFYKYPGTYTVNMLVFDCYNNANLSLFSKDIVVHDYLPMTFRVSLADSPYSTSIAFKCGEISGPFNIEVFYPYYQSASDIYYNIYGSGSENYWDINTNKFSHLENYYSLYDKIYNYAISDYQYREIDKVSTTPDKLYAKLVDGTIINCSPTDVDAFYIGMSATKPVYFKDDTLSDQLILNFFFDKVNYDITPDTLKPNYINNLGVSLSAIVIDNNPTDLSITSNGLDGEGIVIDSFNLNSTKFYNTKIPFVIKLKDVNWFSVKNFNKINIDDFTVTVAVSSGTAPLYTLSTLNYTLSTQNSGGAFRGYIIFDNIPTITSNVKLVANGTFSNSVSSYSLSGESNYFNVFPVDYYEMYKKNEDFIPSTTLRDITFQESIQSNNVLYDNFLSDVLGGENYTHETIGVKIYEKIANFVSNTQDVDTCGVDYLNSLAQYSNFDYVNEEKHIYPETVKRLVDLGSISKYKLFGTTNKFNENLDIKADTAKVKFGRNIGNTINTSTYKISAGTDIVALEKFSNTYKLLNTWQPVSAVETTVYPLSDYSSGWGWPLVLPNSMNFTDMEKYYIFFEYNPQYDNTVVGGVIDFNNAKTTITIDLSSSEFYNHDGILDKMFLNTLYKSLSIIQ